MSSRSCAAATRPATCNKGWEVAAEFGGGSDTNTADTNAAILDALASGVSALTLKVSAADLPAVLDGVLLDLAPITLDAGAATRRCRRSALRGLRRRLGSRPRQDRRRPRCRAADGPFRRRRQRRPRDSRRSRPRRHRPRRDRPRDHRRRHRIPQRRRQRRAGARRRRRGGAGIPAGSDRRRPVDRRRAAPDRVPLRRHRRPVRDHRQVPRRPQGVGANRTGQRCRGLR